MVQGPADSQSLRGCGQSGGSRGARPPQGGTRSAEGSCAASLDSTAQVGLWAEASYPESSHLAGRKGPMACRQGLGPPHAPHADLGRAPGNSSTHRRAVKQESFMVQVVRRTVRAQVLRPPARSACQAQVQSQTPCAWKEPSRRRALPGASAGVSGSGPKATAPAEPQRETGAPACSRPGERVRQGWRGREQGPAGRSPL